MIRSNKETNDYICNHTQVVKSPLTRGHITIKDTVTGEVSKYQNILIQITIRELNKDLIKFPSDGCYLEARSESGEVIISDNTLSK